MSGQMIYTEIVSREVYEELDCSSCLHEKLPSSDVRCLICSADIEADEDVVITCWQPKEGGAK
jgi:hypothetical protein